MARKFVPLLLVPLLGAAFVATDFGASLTGPSVSNAQQKKRPGLLQRLFGPRDQPPRKTAPPRSLSPAKRRIRQPSGYSSGYRTLCVRTCDGYYFPISHSSSRSRLKIDETVCKSMYGGAGAELFINTNGISAERAVSLSGRPLASEPYAFAYRSKFTRSCQNELKSGLAYLEKVFAARIAEAKANAAAPAEPQEQIALPVPVARINPGKDPETLANLAGRFTVAPVKPMDFEAVEVASAAIRRLGPDYYYIAPATIETLYDPPDLGPRFTLVGTAHAADRANKDTTWPGSTVAR